MALSRRLEELISVEDSGLSHDDPIHGKVWGAVFGALRDNKANKIKSWGRDLRDGLSGGMDLTLGKVLAEYIAASTALTSLEYAARTRARATSSH